MIKGCFLENDIHREVPLLDKAGRKLSLKLKGSATQKGKPKTDKIYYRISRVVWGIQTTVNDKIILIEELVFDDGRKELRFSYYTQRHKDGKWAWGQFALIVPPEDIAELLALAQEKGLMKKA
jgi:hypothetical protein